MIPLKRQLVATVQHTKPNSGIHIGVLRLVYADTPTERWSLITTSSQAVHQSRALSHMSSGSCFTSLIHVGNACFPPRSGIHKPEQLREVLFWPSAPYFGSQHLVSAVSILLWQSATCLGSQHLVLAVSALSHIRQAVADLRDVGLLGSRLTLIWRVET